MAREQRITSRSGIYHVVSAAMQERLFTEESDYTEMEEILSDMQSAGWIRIYGYCMLPDHLHLLIKEESRTISYVMQLLESGYARKFNKRHGSCGSLFRNRFESEPAEPAEYYLQILKYIHFNHLKTGLYESSSYEHSSFRDYLFGGGITDCSYTYSLITAEEFLKYHSSYGLEDEIRCADVPKDCRIMLTEDSLDKFAHMDKDEFRRTSTDVKRSVVEKMYSCGLSMRKIGILTNLSTTYVSRLLWAGFR